jgi:BirA family biotin operon repressor/biotin-[acetyl-CoA-carboxylase] ligase
MHSSTPERPSLDVERLRTALGTSSSLYAVEVVDAAPSTNALVAARAREGASEGLVVAAEHQTAGRGRLDRTWVTPPRAALTFSLLVAPGRVPVDRWPWLPLLTGLAVSEGVRRAAGVEASLKWPNDVLVDGLKVAGILVERVETPTGAVAVVGVGLNVSTTRDELPVPSATSLRLAGATSLDRSALLGAVLRAFTASYDGWLSAAGHGLRTSYARACSTIGQRVRVGLPTGETLHGSATGVDERGRLLVDDGTRVHALGAGDVVHVRPDRDPGA